MKALLFVSLFFACGLVAAPITIEIPREEVLSLSLRQEAEMAIDRVARWFEAQPPTENATHQALIAYITKGYVTHQPTEEAMALWHTAGEKLYPYEETAREIVNTQKVTPEGGHWGDFEETLLTALRLRCILATHILPSTQCFRLQRSDDED